MYHMKIFFGWSLIFVAAAIFAIGLFCSNTEREGFIFVIGAAPFGFCGLYLAMMTYLEGPPKKETKQDEYFW